MAKAKPTHERLNAIQAKYMSAVEKATVKIGKSYIDQKFKALRTEAMRKNGHYMKMFGRKVWMQKTYKGTHEGGFLPFTSEEIRVSDAVTKLDDLRKYVEMYGEDPDLLIPKWRQDALELVKEPKILENWTREEISVPDDSKNFVHDYLMRQKSMKEDRVRRLRGIGEKIKL